LVSSFCHWYAGEPSPVAATVKTTAPPGQTCCAVGCCVICVGARIVRVAAFEVAFPPAFAPPLR